MDGSVNVAKRVGQLGGDLFWSSQLVPDNRSFNLDSVSHKRDIGDAEANRHHLVPSKYLRSATSITVPSTNTFLGIHGRLIYR